MTKKKIDVIKSYAEQQETLNKPIDMSGAGEDPAIKALVSDEFTRMSDLDALAVAKAVAKIVRGQLKEELDGTMDKLTQKLVEMEQTSKRWEEDRIKFAEEMYNLAERTRSSTPDKITASVRGAELIQKARIEAGAEAAARKLELDRKVANSPKVVMVHPGIPRTYRVGDAKQVRMLPFKISYEHLVFVFEPNKPTEIPQFIYEHYLKLTEMEKERNKLGEALRDGRNNYNAAIAADKVVDPNYAAEMDQVLTNSGIVLPRGG